MARKQRTVRKRKIRRALSLRQQIARRAALKVLSLMRTEGRSLTAAAAEKKTTKRTVLRYVGSALVKGGPSGRYRATPSDRFRRDLNFLTAAGREEITIRSSRIASRIAEYEAALDHYLKTGDTTRLHQFRGESVRVGGRELPFLTNPKALDRLANAGEIAFEDLYATPT